MPKKLDIKIRETKDLEADDLVSPDCRDLGHDAADEILSQGCASHAGLWKKIRADHLVDGIASHPCKERNDGPSAMVSETLCKILCHNLVVLIHEMCRTWH
jgi:hypothetical protein